MTNDRNVREAAQAVRRHSKRVAIQHGRGHRYGEVIGIDPLRVHVYDTDIKLTEQVDLTLSQHLRTYDLRTGIEVGDTVMITPMRHNDWVAYDVVATTDPFRGDHQGDVSVGGSDSDPVARAAINYIYDVFRQTGLMDPTP